MNTASEPDRRNSSRPDAILVTPCPANPNVPPTAPSHRVLCSLQPYPTLSYPTRRARRAHERYQKAVFLGKLRRHRPDIHETLRKPRSTHQTHVTKGWSSYLQLNFGSRMSNCSPSSNRAATRTHGMGSCSESTHYQEAALHTTGPVGMHPTCPEGSVPHIPYQQPSPMGSCFGSTSGRRHGLAACGVAQRVAARWIGDSGATVWDMVVPLERNNPPPEQLFCQGAESQWILEPDVMELPDAAALCPLVCEHMQKLNAKTSPGFDAVAAPFIKYVEKRVPAVNGRGTDKMNVLAPYIASLFAVMMEKAEIPACWKAAKITRRALCWIQGIITCSLLAAPCIGYMLTFSG
eukprot:1144547-Pelagomonas_calceolata.AAC.1